MLVGLEMKVWMGEESVLDMPMHLGQTELETCSLTLLVAQQVSIQ